MIVCSPASIRNYKQGISEFAHFKYPQENFFEKGIISIRLSLCKWNVTFESQGEQE